MRIQNDKQQIAQLLSKFMAGETSLAEEQLLAQYFRTHDVGEEWAEYKQMFALFDSGEVDIEVKAKPKLVALRWIVAAVAASVLLLLALRLGQHPAEEAPAVTYSATSSQSPQQPVTPPIVKEKPEAVVAEAQPAPQPAKQKRKSRKKRSIQERAMLAEATPKQDDSADASETHHSSLLTPHFSEQDPFLLAAAQTQDIRQRGERLHHEIAQLMNNP